VPGPCPRRVGSKGPGGSFGFEEVRRSREEVRLGGGEVATCQRDRGRDQDEAEHGGRIEEVARSHGGILPREVRKSPRSGGGNKGWVEGGCGTLLGEAGRKSWALMLSFPPPSRIGICIYNALAKRARDIRPRHRASVNPLRVFPVVRWTSLD
jgi:hypothetical protein